MSDLERILQRLHDSEIRCGIQTEPPAGGITAWIDYGDRTEKATFWGIIVGGRQIWPSDISGHLVARDRAAPVSRQQLCQGSRRLSGGLSHRRNAIALEELAPRGGSVQPLKGKPPNPPRYPRGGFIFVEFILGNRGHGEWNVRRSRRGATAPVHWR